MNCRCGHGRGTHRKARGKTHLPCQAMYRVEVQASLAPSRTTWELAKCQCRDYVLPGGKTTWGQPAKKERPA